jgi:hypothetical protein
MALQSPIMHLFITPGQIATEKKQEHYDRQERCQYNDPFDPNPVYLFDLFRLLTIIPPSPENNEVYHVNADGDYKSQEYNG